MKTKVCRICKKRRRITQFHKNRANKDGYKNICKDCNKIHWDKSRHDKKYRDKNRLILNKKSNDYYYEHKQEIVIKRKKRYKQSPDGIKTKSLKYYYSNKSKIICRLNEYYKKRRKTDLNFRLIHNLRSRLCSALKGQTKSKRTLELLGCSILQLRLHLEGRFKSGMTWDNYGQWQIDHIKPLSKFDLTDEKQLSKAANYKNLQPLWARENIVKGNK